MYNGCDGHYSEKGHAVLAGAIAPQLAAALNWQPAPAPAPTVGGCAAAPRAKKRSSALGPGLIAGMVIGSLATIALGAYVVVRRRKQQPTATADGSSMNAALLENDHSIEIPATSMPMTATGEGSAAPHAGAGTSAA